MTPDPPPELPRSAGALEPAEEELLALVWLHLGERSGPARQATRDLAEAVPRLVTLWQALQAEPSILKLQILGARHRDLASVEETLWLAHPYTAEIFLPTRASVCRTFLLARLGFCRLLGSIVAGALGGDASRDELQARVERAETSAVCTVMAEEILRMIACDDGLEADVRRKATRVLVQMWELRACEVSTRLFPVLDSVWQAKARAAVSFGSLTGVAELLDLARGACDSTFVDCFSREGVTEDEELALQEFVFNLSYEQLRRLEEHMSEHGSAALDPEAVARILQVPVSELHVRTRRSEDMILTFRERQALATGRRAFGLPGPKRTAEQHLMVFILGRTSDEDLLACEES